MKDITGKTITLRKALTIGFISMTRESMDKIRNNQISKGSVLDTARASGFIAAKNTQNLIPHCHPVTIDGMKINFNFLVEGDTLQHTDTELDSCGIQVVVEVKSIGRTGIEMEALTAASLTCLTIYDMIKYLNDPLVEISSIKLIEKRGGKSDRKKFVREKQKAALLVCSEDILAGKKENKISPLITGLLEKNNCELTDEIVIQGSDHEIIHQIKKWADDKIPFIFTAGGTGLGLKDEVADVVNTLIEKKMEGVIDAMQMHGTLRTPLAMLSRTTAGIYRDSMIITLPGSANGARESLEAILPAIFHVRNMIKKKRN